MSTQNTSVLEALEQSREQLEKHTKYAPHYQDPFPPPANDEARTLEKVNEAIAAIEALQAENELLKGYRDRSLELATAYNNAQENIDQINTHREHILVVNDKLRCERDALQVENESLRNGVLDLQTQLALTCSKLVPLEAVSAEYNDWIRHHAGGGDFDGFLKLRHPPQEEAGSDCTPNHNCKGRMVHLPIGEQCDKCGGHND